MAPSVTTMGVVALVASSAKSSSSRKNSERSVVESPVGAVAARGGGGFGNKSKRTNRSNNSSETDNEIAKRTVRNLFSVCSHIQDPTLYQPHWANNARCRSINDSDSNNDNNVEDKVASTVVATSKNVKKGEVLTLFPIHALGLRWLRRNNKDDTEFIAYDYDRDNDFFSNYQPLTTAGLRTRLNIPLEEGQPAADAILASLGGINHKKVIMFAMFDASRETRPGWLGGRIKSVSPVNPFAKVPPFYGANCVTMPLPGVAPLCGIVALKDLEEGEELVQSIRPPDRTVLEECNGILWRDYEGELRELRTYIEMACNPVQTINDKQRTSDKDDNILRADDQSTPPLSTHKIGPFHKINLHYPGLKQIHKNPDIFIIDNFLSNDECNKVIIKASSHLKPCLVKNASTGMVENDPSRTSTNTNLPQCEAPTIVSKIISLACCRVDQLEILQVLRYDRGQEFRPHTDGFDGPTSACGFEESNRLVTIFCYLNNVDRGGCTYFPEIDLEIRPKKGMAVVHFPSDVALREDERTLHQGMPAVDEKWLLTTWVWSKRRSDGKYDEEHLATLNTDLI